MIIVLRKTGPDDLSKALQAHMQACLLYFSNSVPSPFAKPSNTCAHPTGHSSLENSSRSMPRCHVPCNSPVFSVCSIRRCGSVACTTPSYGYRYGRSPAPTDRQHTGSKPRRPLARRHADRPAGDSWPVRPVPSHQPSEPIEHVHKSQALLDGFVLDSGQYSRLTVLGSS